MLLIGEGNEFDPEENIVYKLLKKVLPITKEYSGGKFTKIINGKKHFTMLFVVMILLATIDLVFAFDSLPAVFAITQSKMIIYTSNIFAVLGLRSLFFLIRGAVDKFRYLKEGIAIVLIFIGAKMLITYFDIHLHIWVSLAVIVGCLSFAILFSILKKERPIDSNAEIF